MGRAHQNAVAQHAAGFGIGLGRRELKFRAVELVRDLSGVPEPSGEAVDSRRNRGATLQEAATGPPRASRLRVVHNASLPWVFSRQHTACSDGFKYHNKISGVTC